MTFSNEADSQADDVLAAKPTCNCWTQGYDQLKTRADAEGVDNATADSAPKGQYDIRLNAGGMRIATIRVGDRWLCERRGVTGSNVNSGFISAGMAKVCRADLERYIVEFNDNAGLDCIGDLCPEIPAS